MKQLARRQQETPSLFEALMRRVRDLAGRNEHEGGLREHLEELIEETEEEEQQQLTEQERALLLNALSFGELRVDDVMVPRADIRGVAVDSGIAEVVAAMQKATHSRLLVFRETLDDVLGIVHLKDLLPFWGDGDAFNLEQVMRPLLVVPPSMRVIDLLLEMRDTRMHMAIVVDEFGGTDGLVTIEDLVEEIVGELNDEHDKVKPPELVEVEPGVIDADARIYLEDLEERLGLELLDEEERDEADTLAGLIFTLVDRVPAKGEIVSHPSGIEFEILEADPRRIKRVRIRSHPPASTALPAAPDEITT
jgi:CBS domain containing-hemolysin-like protein